MSWKRRVLFGATAGGLLAPGTASAGEEDRVLMPGLAFVIQEDSAGETRYGVGLEVSYVTLGDAPAAFGALAQLEFLSGGEIRLGLGAEASAFVGFETAPSLRYDGEGIEPGFQLAPFLSAGYAYASYRVLFSHYEVAGTLD